MDRCLINQASDHVSSEIDVMGEGADGPGSRKSPVS